MKRLVLALALAACGLTAGATSAPKVAYCAYCYPGTCYTSLICGKCVCLKTGTNTSGVCASID